MKIVIVRHADPDYSADSLTEVGWEEAQLLADRLCRLDVKEIYVSPLGRARDTASVTLKKMDREAVTCDWLREFWPPIHRPDREGLSICWDWLPADWTRESAFFDYRYGGKLCGGLPSFQPGSLSEPVLGSDRLG